MDTKDKAKDNCKESIDLGLEKDTKQLQSKFGWHRICAFTFLKWKEKMKEFSYNRL